MVKSKMSEIIKHKFFTVRYICYQLFINLITRVINITTSEKCENIHLSFKSIHNWKKMRISPEKISDSMKMAVKLTEELIHQLEGLEQKAENKEVIRKTANSIGTTISTVGIALAVGAVFFSGGLSLLAASIGTTMVGTTTNYITDLVHRKETKDCMMKISTLTEEFEFCMVELERLLNQFTQQVENTMTVNEIDFEEALLLELGSLPKDCSFRIAVEAMLIFLTSKVFENSVFVFSIMSTKMNLITTSTSFAAIASLKTSTMITKAGIIGTFGAGAGAVVQTIGKGAVVLGAAVTVFEVAKLVRSFLRSSQSLQAIEEVKKGLSEELKVLKKKSEEFQELQQSARLVLKKALIAMLEELFGGGFKEEENDVIEPLMFEKHIDRLGREDKGGIFDLHFIADLTGRIIEIVDKTDAGNNAISDTILRIKPSEISSSEPIKIAIVIDDNQIKFKPVNSNGALVDITTPTGEDFSLINSVAHSAEMTRNVLIERIKLFYRNEKVAEMMFNEDMSRIFPEKVFDGIQNGRRKKVPGNMVKVERETIKNDTKKEITSVVRKENLFMGISSTLKVRKQIRKNAKPGDQIGQLISAMLGGDGNDVINFAPMTKCVNKCLCIIQEYNIRYLLLKNDGWYVKVTHILDYETKSSLRPFKISLNAEFFDSNNCSQYIINEEFDNK